MIDEARKIHKNIHALAQDVPETNRAEEFALDIMQKSDDILKWVEDNETVTDAQLQALRNMEKGLGRWVHR